MISGALSISIRSHDVLLTDIVLPTYLGSFLRLLLCHIAVLLTKLLLPSSCRHLPAASPSYTPVIQQRPTAWTYSRRTLFNLKLEISATASFPAGYSVTRAQRLFSRRQFAKRSPSSTTELCPTVCRFLRSVSTNCMDSTTTENGSA
ncbi:hypothetical protein M378DRAFT_321793 [Amanita muscaria Koide BX008]|uniref:Uncharacterized protein n=1 Tax=Amanita muscaria (strain Koide BX008) TaxID=946122 RepID=A0A0C2XDP0_AMAMK|nr:hypothetical protein M378DRAFT_321793 [Amanita muscaria Koide BX008]